MKDFDIDRRLFAAPKLREVIRDRGLLESWVARQVGISKGHFSMVLSGRRTLPEWQARLVAAHLGYDFYLLFEVSDEVQKTSPSEALAS